MAEIVNSNPINETHANVRRTRSTFALKQRIMDTHRFGEYHPHLVIDGITSDRMPWRSSHNARSYTLKAPLMQDIQMHKDYFMVPLRAILPMNADKIITNPTAGSDVPSDAYCNVDNFLGKVHSISDAFVTYMLTIDITVPSGANAFCTFYVKWLIFLESVFSNGSLLASLGANFNHCLRLNYSGISTHFDIDRFLDDFVIKAESTLQQAYPVVQFGGIGGDIYRVYDGPHDDPVSANGYPYITWHEFLQKVRDDADWVFINEPFTSSTLVSELTNGSCIISNISGSGNTYDVDISRLWAYHLCCAAFYTDDKIDHIYSAELFRQYIFALAYGLSSGNLSFTYNGFSLPYDYLSAKYFAFFASQLASSIFLSTSDFLLCYQYFLTLFGYHRSLRFKDYFTGSRARPLAVGNTQIPVVSNQVSVVDVSRNIQVQRFLNAVQSTGRKFEEYLKGIFGVAPSPDHHNPLFLAHTSDSLFAAEVENTGAAQQSAPNSVTAVFRGNGSQYEFSVDVDEPCIILGITSYDIERSYVGGIERSFFKKDRYDMFLPDLQFIGDQAVYHGELIAASNNPTSPMGYQYRDMQWKQLVNRACGAFAQAGQLPGYAFLYDGWRYAFWNPIISPDFIRSKNVELDQFYLSLTGHSLGTYFHFIVVNENVSNASRPMAYNPQILG